MWTQRSQLLLFEWKTFIDIRFVRSFVDLASEVKVKNNLKFETGAINRGVPLVKLK